MSTFNVGTLEDCLNLLGSSEPFLKSIRVNNDGCIEPFTHSGNIAYEKLRKIIVYLADNGVVDHFDEDLLDSIANGEY